jgi:CDP-glucose 4,6-dehydratase
VLDALAGYLRLGEALLSEPLESSEAWNFGPDPGNDATVAEVVAIFLGRLGALGGRPSVEVVTDATTRPPERRRLTLSSEKARARLGWAPCLGFRESVEWSAEWYHDAADGSLAVTRKATASQIDRYLRREGERFSVAHDAELVLR